MKLIILDRDGVINRESDLYIKSPDEWSPLKGSLEAISQLNKNNWKVCIATNQSGIGRGLYTIDTMNLIHEKMKKELKKFNANIDYISYCPHKPEDNCKCRKPKPGMYIEIGKLYNYDLNNAIVVGDSERDIVAAEKVGAKSMLVLTGKGKKTIKERNLPERTTVYKNLAEVVKAII